MADFADALLQVGEQLFFGDDALTYAQFSARVDAVAQRRRPPDAEDERPRLLRDDVDVPEAITVQELAKRMGERGADLVKALFIASFRSDEPFPQVLSAALTRVYEEAGWDLALGETVAAVGEVFGAMSRRRRRIFCASTGMPRFTN